jgi:hypothetical protein
MMSKSDREELTKVVRMHAKVAKEGVALRQAELLADFEAQLAAKYKVDYAAWKDITAHAEKGVAEANERIVAICRERGVPEAFGPRLTLSWFDRGENALKERREELRKVARTRFDAAARAARLVVERWEADVLGRLIAGGLASEEARAFLESIPQPEELMTPLSVEGLNGAVKRLTSDP